MASHDPLAAPAAPGVAAQPFKPFDVFLSYSRKDQVAVGRVAVALKHRGVEPWLDRWCLTRGGHWHDELAAGLAASRTCAVFVGREDLGPWEREEIELAMDHAGARRDFRVFPVLLPGVSPLDTGALPPFLRARKWVDLRGEAAESRGLDELVHAIRGTSSRRDAPIAARGDVAPYRGLRAFEAEHAPFFFGRDGDVQRLLERLRSGRFVAIVGASGSGKSSLARAGLVPALRAGGLPGSDGWRIAVVRPGGSPLEALASAAAVLGDDRGMERALAELLRGERGLHLAVQYALADRANGERALVVVDQLEEAFTLCRDARERAAAFDNLAYAASRPRGRCVVVVTMRADFLPRLADHRPLAQLIETRQELVGPLGAHELREAIEGPARGAGLDVEHGLADTILDDAGREAGALPLVEHALLETWRRRSAGRLTLEGYRAAGGVQAALADRAEEVFGALTPAQQDAARRLLPRLAQPADAPPAAILDPAAERPAVDEVIARFADAQLLRAGRDGSVDLPGQALTRGWPRLQGWIDDGRVALVTQRRMTEAAAEWLRADRDPGALYRGIRLAQARECVARREIWPDDDEREFLAASAARERRAARARRIGVFIKG